MRTIPRIMSVIIVLNLAGCSDATKLSNFAFKNQKAQAQQKWDSVRADVKLQLVRQHLEAGRLGEAEKALDQVISLSPHDARPFVLATRLRLEQGKLAEAKEAIDVALVMHGADAETDYWAGVVAQRYSNLETALSYYEAASAKAPLVSAYVTAQAETLLALDRPADGMHLISSRLSDFDGDVSLRVIAARTAKTLNLRDPAVRYSRDAIFMSKSDRVIITQVAGILDWGTADQELIEVLSPLVGQKPALPASLQCMLAQAYLRSGRIADGKKVLQGVSEEGAFAALISARAAMAEGDLAGAAKFAQASMEQTDGRKSAEAFLIIGYFSLHNSDARNALKMSEQALSLEPRSVPALCIKGQACEALGELDQARWSYLDALSIDPGDVLPKALLDKMTSRLPMDDDENDATARSHDSVSMGNCNGNEPCEGNE